MPTTTWRAFMALGQPDHALGALRRALAVTEAADTEVAVRPVREDVRGPPNGEDFRALMVGRCPSRGAAPTIWRRSPRASSVRTTRSRRAIERAVAAQPRRLAIDELLGLSGLAELARHRLLRCLMERRPSPTSSWSDS